MLRILIADDHDVLRKGVRSLIESHAGWEVCGEAADGHHALEIALSENPDVAIVDVTLPTMNGLALTLRLRQEAPATSVLLFTMHDDDETISSGLAAGARGYVLKNDGAQVLEAAISALGAKRPYFSPYVSNLLLNAVISDGRRGRLQSFTKRELEIGQLIAEGEPSSTIARVLGISIKTVETHRSAAMRKAGVRTSAAMVRFLIKHHLVQA